ncbi:hypothetical protein BKA93DRAFT_776524 [Sparassis latifolia]
MIQYLTLEIGLAGGCKEIRVTVGHAQRDSREVTILGPGHLKLPAKFTGPGDLPSPDPISEIVLASCCRQLR